MTDIFLSYASEDVKRAGRVAALLEQQGWDVFWDRDRYCQVKQSPVAKVDSTRQFLAHFKRKVVYLYEIQVGKQHPKPGRPTQFR